MKKYLLIIIAIGVLSSCSDYLDVRPASQIDKDLLFETEEGFLEALNGIYSRGASPDIYGNELTFGFLDVMAQNYSVVDITGTAFPYQQTALFNFRDKDFVARRDAVWSGLYNAIGNCNLLLENLALQRVILPEQTRSLIKGEALGLRAFFHLDVIRMFAPSYQSNPNTPAVPYVSKFIKLVSPQLTTAAALDSVIRDLTEARALLKEVDPIVAGTYKVGYTRDGDDGDVLPDDGSNEAQGSLFLQNRRHRFNYYAVCAALARAHLCRGNNAEALAAAEEVILAAKFPWTKKDDFINVEDEQKDRILYKELIFAWAVPTQRDELRDRFERGASSLYVRQAPGNGIFETAGAGGEDLRYKQWFKLVTENSSSRLQLMKYHREDDNLHPLMAPALRLSEMYYIASEASYDKDQSMAWTYFNAIRFQRGIAGAYEITSGSKEKLLTELVKEARKEFYGEGQIFYMFKRLHRNMQALDGAVITASDAIYVLPMPDAELEIGQRD